MTREKKIITYISLAVCFLIIFIYCLSPFAVGLNHGGNNNEFENALGLSGANDGYFYTGYNIVGDGYAVNGSMYNILKPIISFCGKISQYFDIRILSFIYALMLLVSVYYLNKYINFGNRTLDIIFAVLIIFVVFDISYLLYLNTLYAEGMFYALFVLAVSLYIKLIKSDKPQLPTTIVFILISLVICGLKPNLLLMVIPFVAMIGYLIYKRKSLLFRIVVCLMTILLIVYPVINYNNYQNENTDKFHSVFYGILYENKNVENTLKKFDIDSKYNVLAGKNIYNELEFDINSQEFKKEVIDKISYTNIVKYYITNPNEYLNQYKYVGWNAFETSPKYVGNFTSASGKTAYDIAKGFNVFNLLKSKLFPKTLWFIYLIPILLAVILIAYKKKFNLGFIVFGIAMSFINLILFNVPMITGGLVDISRTMAIYNISFDVIFIMIIACMLHISSQRKQEFKEKYGLTQ